MKEKEDIGCSVACVRASEWYQVKVGYIEVSRSAVNAEMTV